MSYHNSALLQGCVHWWMIEAPDGETSEGRCRRCGELKMFVTSGEYTVKEDRPRRWGDLPRRVGVKVS